jgi:hypothetical protein
VGTEISRCGLVDGEMGESPTAQQLTFQESRWIQIESIAWLKRVAEGLSLDCYKTQMPSGLTEGLFCA